MCREYVVTTVIDLGNSYFSLFPPKNFGQIFFPAKIFPFHFGQKVIIFI